MPLSSVIATSPTSTKTVLALMPKRSIRTYSSLTTHGITEPRTHGFTDAFGEFTEPRNYGLMVPYLRISVIPLAEFYYLLLLGLTTGVEGQTQRTLVSKIKTFFFIARPPSSYHQRFQRPSVWLNYLYLPVTECSCFPVCHV